MPIGNTQAIQAGYTNDIVEYDTEYLLNLEKNYVK
jgi:hypothetical protein